MRVATVDAVSGHTVESTLSLEARRTPIKGAFVKMNCDADTLLGRVISVDLTNVVHDNPTFAPFIMQHGSVPMWSGDVDIEKAKIELIRAVDGNGSFIALRRNPPSGTAVEAVGPNDIATFYNEKEHLITLGEIPNSEGVPASTVNRHFGAFDTGGYGEARHTAIFGRNGSGKTVLATMLIAARLAAHPEMGLLMPDTAGDLSNPASHSRGDFQWNYISLLEASAVTVEHLNITNIRLTSAHTLRMKLAPTLKIHLSTTDDKADEIARKVVAEIIDDDNHVTLTQFTSDRVAAAIVKVIDTCFAPSSKAQRQTDAKDLESSPKRRQLFDRDIARIAALFDGREEIGHLIHAVLQRGRKVIIDVTTDISLTDQEFVMREIMSQLGWQSQRAFKQKGNSSCNALVVLDEGQRWVPQDSVDDGGIGRTIRQQLRETRKYGLGWMIVSQSPSGIHNDVLRQSHTTYFGRGLGIGADENHLRQNLGNHGFEAYKQLELQGGFFWIGVGLDNNIGTDSSYFSFHPFGGDATTSFKAANPAIFGLK